jgi:hypothetical protein
VVVTWDEADTDRFMVLLLSESDPPRVLPATGTSLVLAPDELAAADGYCIAVARADMISDLAGPDPGSDGSGTAERPDIGPAFSAMSCIRGASSSTVRVDT